MRAGARRHAITIQRQVQVGTLNLGEPNKVWQTFVECMAEMTVRRGREHWDTQTKRRYSEEVYHFRCDFYDVRGVNASMRIVDEDSQQYNIKALLPDTQNRTDVIIECTLQDSSLGAEALMGYIDAAIPAGVANAAYGGFTVKGRGGTAPYTFAVTSGSLPNGLTLNASTGAVSGTPTLAGTFSGIVITVTDAEDDTHAMPAFGITIA